MGVRAVIWAQHLLLPPRLSEIAVDIDQFVAKMIVKVGPEKLDFADWSEALYAYAAALERIEVKLTEEEMADLIDIGAQFYRTLARAEDYRRLGVRNSPGE